VSLVSLTVKNVMIITTALDAIMIILWITKLINAFQDQIVIKNYSFMMEHVLKSAN
jgi:hypothetical protein